MEDKPISYFINKDGVTSVHQVFTHGTIWNHFAELTDPEIWEKKIEYHVGKLCVLSECSVEYFNRANFWGSLEVAVEALTEDAI